MSYVSRILWALGGLAVAAVDWALTATVAALTAKAQGTEQAGTKPPHPDDTLRLSAEDQQAWDKLAARNPDLAIAAARIDGEGRPR